ncbi:MAG: nicotianamine synthase family protein [Alphaproteobacteria bacterium]|jgi:hypothetical protein
MPTAMLKQEAISAIRASYQLLRTEKNLSPLNDRVTHSLTHLVRTLTRCQSPELAKFLLDAPELAIEREHLPILCGIAECEMEKFWARHLIARPVCDLAEFWYFPEYTELCQAELDLFKTRRFDRISFLGAGALPLTAFLLARHCPQSDIICVDFDEEACALAEKLSRKIGLKDQVSVQRMDALQYVPAKNELVICASLLQGREQVYQNMQGHDCALIVRDSEGPYQYLYKAAELPSAASFREIAKTQMDARRINTSRYFERATEWMDSARAA